MSDFPVTPASHEVFDLALAVIELSMTAGPDAARAALAMLDGQQVEADRFGSGDAVRRASAEAVDGRGAAGFVGVPDRVTADLPQDVLHAVWRLLFELAALGIEAGPHPLRAGSHHATRDDVLGKVIDLRARLADPGKSR